MTDAVIQDSQEVELDLSSVEFDIKEINEILDECGLEESEINRKVVCDVLIAICLAGLCKDYSAFQGQINQLMEIGAFAEEEREIALSVMEQKIPELRQEIGALGDIDAAIDNLTKLGEYLRP